MNENINLCEILKDCPKGTIFYSPLFGKVSFQIADTSIQVRTVLNDTVCFLPDGNFSMLGMASPEVMLFPSCEQRDWSKWKCPNPKFDPKTLKPFDKVITKSGDYSWKCDIFSYYRERENKSIVCYCMSEDYIYDKCIPYNDDTKHLVGTTDEAPEFYRYWED